MKVTLPVFDETASSLRRDGSRNYVHPADVHGRFSRLRSVLFAVLIAVLVLLPFVPVNGHPAVFIDIERREFFLLGATFNAQDVWLAFFPLSGIGFVLIVMTALWGRVWCGYACPHTVFLEGVFRPLERLLEGPRNVRLRRNAAPMTFDKFWRKTIKHVCYLVLAFALAHLFMAYFVSVPRLYRMVLSDPSAHPTAFVWAATLTLLLYVNFSWFREQLCLIVCPYGRLQSVLTDQDTVVIGYDVTRGEPRGKANEPGVGDCIDCKRCIVVCPTGIDIRHGLQIDCVACARCIDACDEVMVKLDRPRGLIRYDSQNGLSHEPTRFLRPRVYLYAALGLAGVIAAAIAFTSSRAYEANLLRLQGAPPFTLENETVRNSFEVHLLNKRSQPLTMRLQGDASDRIQYIIAMPELQLRSLQSIRVPVFVSFRKGAVHDGESAAIRVHTSYGDELLHAPLIAPH